MKVRFCSRARGGHVFACPTCHVRRIILTLAALIAGAAASGGQSNCGRAYTQIWRCPTCLQEKRWLYQRAVSCLAKGPVSFIEPLLLSSSTSPKPPIRRWRRRPGLHATTGSVPEALPEPGPLPHHGPPPGGDIYIYNIINNITYL